MIASTEGVAPESQRDSQQRLAMPREQEPRSATESGGGRPCLDCGRLLGKREGWFCFDSSQPGKNGTVCNQCHDARVAAEEDDE